MNKPSLVVIIRHAESMRNKAKKGNAYFADDAARSLIKGIPDYKISLTEEGFLQAKATGAYLKKKFGEFDCCYHSGFLRTIQTLETILEAYPKKYRSNVKIRESLLIRERHAGYAYDMTEQEVDKYFPWLKEYWDTQGSFFACPPGGESLAKAAERVEAFRNEINRKRAGQKVLIVSHGGAIRCFRYLLEHWTYHQVTHLPKDQVPKNCGLTVYKYDKNSDALQLDEYNTIAYSD